MTLTAANISTRRQCQRLCLTELILVFNLLTEVPPSFGHQPRLSNNPSMYGHMLPDCKRQSRCLWLLFHVEPSSLVWWCCSSSIYTHGTSSSLFCYIYNFKSDTSTRKRNSEAPQHTSIVIAPLRCPKRVNWCLCPGCEQDNGAPLQTRLLVW